jgi:tungstate transport system ATP-binding protein
VLFLHHGKLAEHSAAGSFFENPKSAAAKAYLAGKLVL